MAPHYIIPLTQHRLPASIGAKARNLRTLMDKGYKVPDSYICTWDAYQSYLHDDVRLLDQLIAELSIVVNPEINYAIRSSANVEDSENYSFAGQFKSMLDIRGTNPVLQAIWAVWATAQSTEVRSYLGESSQDQSAIKMAVIIQEMIRPEISGVSFSKNPITCLDEIVVEAVMGRGDLLMKQGITPHRWVNKWGSWLCKPDLDDFPAGLMEEIVDRTRQISKSLHKDVDLEWVFDGKNLYWVQLRDITSIRGGNVFSNRISKEMIPGLIKPLVWSVAIPTHSALWLQILQDMIGNNNINLSDMIRAFKYRAYFNVSVFGEVFKRLGMPQESLEMMMGLVPPNIDKPHFKPSPGMVSNIPRMTSFLWNYAHFDRIAKQALPEIEKHCYSIPIEVLPQLDEKQILIKLDELHGLYRQISHHTIIVQMMMHIYNRILKSLLERKGVDFHLFNLTEGMPELDRYNPNISLANLASTFRTLDSEVQQRIQASDYQEFQSLSGIEDFQLQVADFLENFGYLSESAVDFSHVPWHENPDLVLKIIIEYPAFSEQTLTKISLRDLSPGWLSGIVIRSFYRRARLFRYYREAFSSLFSRVLGLLRSHYLALAEQLSHNETLLIPDDIFYLYHDELKKIVSDDMNDIEVKRLIAERKEEMEQSKGVELPEVIFGDTAPPAVVNAKKTFSGVPTSRGYYTGRVKVIEKLSEFPKLQPGNVLVIPFSDTGWLPLFRKAGAVIAESGGMLSHSSIIAREYNIPAVVSVAGALLLKDDTLVHVDGFKGEIKIIEG